MCDGTAACGRRFVIRRIKLEVCRGEERRVAPGEGGITTPCSRPRIARLSCARLAASAVVCAAADGGRYADRVSCVSILDRGGWHELLRQDHYCWPTRERVGRTHVELDALHWGSNWSVSPDFAKLVEEAVGVTMDRRRELSERSRSHLETSDCDNLVELSVHGGLSPSADPDTQATLISAAPLRRKLRIISRSLSDCRRNSVVGNSNARKEATRVPDGAVPASIDTLKSLSSSRMLRQRRFWSGQLHNTWLHQTLATVFY